MGVDLSLASFFLNFEINTSILHALKKEIGVNAKFQKISKKVTDFLEQPPRIMGSQQISL